jgi:hypothetical protein
VGCTCRLVALETPMSLPDLYVGKIVHFVGIGTPVRGRHFPAIVVRIADEGINRVVLTIFTDQVERCAASSTRRESSVGYSAEMTPGTWHYIEDCHRADAT